MTTVYGPNVPMPPNLAPNLDIDTDKIRETILDNIWILQLGLSGLFVDYDFLLDVGLKGMFFFRFIMRS